jgi:N6-L-threonylcarbamoyladenine synthase
MIRILGIESSCDDTSVAILEERKILANLIANQAIHAEYGGVVPELASRAHQKNIIPALDSCLKRTKLELSDLDAIAYTRGPGLSGSLLVGSSFAKGLSMGLSIPLIEVNHMQAHILAHFIEDNASTPQFPFLCLTVSGGHTQIVLVKSPLEMEILGTTLDDAAGEAFDKAAKMMELPYPGGPLIDRYAKEGDPERFSFNAGVMEAYNFSFSGLKTNILYFLKQEVEKNPNFIQNNLADLCASIQKTIIDTLFVKLKKAVEELGIKEVAIAGGVSANSALRARLMAKEQEGWVTHIPKFEYCTDNAAMIAMAGHFLYKEKVFGSLASAPLPRMKF